MEISKKFKDNLGVIIAISTILGMGISVVNFYILASISPLATRVEALEENNARFMPLDLSMEKWKNNDLQHTVIEKKLDLIDTKIDLLLQK